MTQQAVAAKTTREFLGQRERAIASAWAGFAMDSYSIYITTTALLPALAYFQGPHPTASGLALFSGLTLAATLLGRPLGGIIFGHFSDRMSRRTTGTVTILGFGTMSLLIACLPGASAVGAGGAVALLLAFRFIEGIFLGGEYTAATPLALEYAPPGRRGLIGSSIQCAASIGPFFVALLMSLVLIVAPNNGASSPYVQWGWRIPFIIGFVLAVLVAWFIRRRVEDSETFKAAAAARRASGRSPLLGLLRGNSARAFVQAWALATGVFFISNIVGSVGPQFLLLNKGFTASELAHTNLITPFPGAAAYVLMGWLSDYIGRKRALYIAGIFNLIILPFTMTALGSGHIHQWYQLTLVSVLTFVCLGMFFGVLPAFINERFATSMRSSGWGVAYSTAVIIPAFFSYYMQWLGHVMPFLYTAGLLVIVGVIFVIVATAMSPETRGVDLSTIEA